MLRCRNQGFEGEVWCTVIKYKGIPSRSASSHFDGGKIKLLPGSSYNNYGAQSPVL